MVICLKTYSKYAKASEIELTVQDRLPLWIGSPCQVHCSFLVTSMSDYYVLQLTITAILPMTCQRCLRQEDFSYHHSIDIALCRTESRADTLMSSYDCIVVEGDTLDLETVIVDELHLSSPPIPHETTQCDPHQLQ